MRVLDLDPSSLREWLAAVGLLRLVTETTDTGRLAWRLDTGRYRLAVEDVPHDLAQRCADWIAIRRPAWHFAGRQNVDFDAEFWRTHALAASGVEAVLWCAIASDAVWHPKGRKLQASKLEFAQGGGHQDWLFTLRKPFVDEHCKADELARVLDGRPAMPPKKTASRAGKVSRWDPDCDRDHAYLASAPADEPVVQDQTINALAAIGFASCPSAPSARGLVTPIVHERGVLRWPVWPLPIRLADLEAALCCGWSWPTMEARRWHVDKLIRFSRGELREPEAYRSFS
jgi:hypothetical protein